MISNRYQHGLMLVSIMLLTLMGVALCTQAHAQDSMDIRASDQSGFSRLVFDGKDASGYSVSQQGSALIVTFKNAAQANIGDVGNTKNIGTVNLQSGANEPLSVSVQIPEGSKFRHFKIGNRVMVDVYDSTSSSAPTRSAAVDTPPKKEPVKEPIKEVEVEKEPVVESPAQEELTPTANKTEEPAEQMPAASGDAHVITISTTRNVGLAVFERAGYLWIVEDNPTLKIPPIISGPEKDKFGKFEEIEMIGGKAFRLLKPEGAYFYGEGGGLLWRIIFTPNPRGKKALAMQTREATAKTGGVLRSLFWPMGSAAKVLTLTDPLLGDDIKIVTAEDTSQYIGPAREMVEMEILPSIVGMAVVSRVDDLNVDVVEEGVNVSSAAGLAVSPLSDTASLNLKDDIEKEGKMFERLESPDNINQIFDFTSWEMGGLKVLDENRRILMLGAANKQGNTKTEDLITLAKLNLANDRGPEALGLLRVAENVLPGIEETPEFLALRGAAATLAHKDDEAIVSLAKPAIQQYDEINYWKAAALAGLEDWQQADKVMPQRLDVLEQYPAKIKEPLALALTEVALRAGKLILAERLLAMLEPKFADMSIPRQSSWKYLQGELERQRGNDDEALKNWETLLTGKDDYYRAKAGLSVTKLQLDRQKITPAKAIDRLEGLRYAWRGDELETTINYRLGQVYIENKEYLKGLAVLRNAVGLSPNTKLSDEVTDYMTSSFRSLFTDGSLSKMSPVDAVSIYEEFKELTPPGDEGNVFVQNLAERLVEVGLLSRATTLLEDQMNFRLKGEDKTKVAIRLAAIRLLDNKADGAIQALDVAQIAATEAGTNAYDNEIKMLRASALSKNGEANKALALLTGLPSTMNLAKLRADIAWNGGLWNDAANAFGDIIAFEKISMTRPMSEYEENLVLNRSIALNLSGNQTELSALRDKYGDLMKQSAKARIFEMVTRQKQLGVLENRESIKSFISEVNLFGDFLENYKAGN